MLTFFENAVNCGMCPQPNELYRGVMQANLNEQWDNTSARYLVQEQVDFGGSLYQNIEVWINYVVGQGSTGQKNGDDFRQLAFEEIDHPCIRGRQYKFDDNIWIAYFTDEYDSIAKTLAVRRCNNFLRWINPENGNLESVPCVVDYDMSSPSVQVTQSILTPNNHAVVMVQGNDLTNTQLITNMRFILGNRPFKLYGYQNTIMDDLSTPEATLLYLDLYLDEKQANDSLPKALAFNGHYNYTIVPNQLSIENVVNATGLVSATTLLNGSDVIRPLKWNSEDTSIITIDNNTGEYTVVGTVGQSTNITVNIDGNLSSMVKIPVTIVNAVTNVLDLTISPFIERIREYENIDFDVEVSKNSAPYANFQSTISLSDSAIVLSNNYLTLKEISVNKYNISCSKFGSANQVLYVTVTDISTGEQFKESFNIKTVNMFG